MLFSAAGQGSSERHNNKYKLDSLKKKPGEVGITVFSNSL